MQPRDHLAKARRWAKFPATVLFVTGVIWLLMNYFKLDWSAITQNSETGIGALFVFGDMVVIPLGSFVIGVCVMFLQRWALWGTIAILAPPLVQSTLTMASRVDYKFTAYHTSQDVTDFGAGIMTAIQILAVWAIYGIVLFHVKKALDWHSRARQWVRRPSTEADRPAGDPVRHDRSAGEGEDPGVCLLMPDMSEEDQA